MNTNLLKRFISLMLIFALVVTSVNLSWATETDNSIKITDGQIVAENYKKSLGLTDEEINILKDNSIRGEIHTLTAPTVADELITVNSDEKSISAKEYTDAEGNVWLPEAAEVVYTEGSENVELKDGKGSFTYTGKNYSVEVTYNSYVNVDSQNTLVNTPYYLAKGVENLDILADDCSTYLMLMETIIPQMMVLVDGSMIVKLESGSEAAKAINEFNRQITENGTLDLLGYIEGDDGYLNADSKTKFLLDKGSEIRACVKETYEYAKAIADEEYIQNIIKVAEGFSSFQDKAKQLKRAMQQIELLVESLAPVYEDPWYAVNYILLRSEDDYKKLLENMLPEGTVIADDEAKIDYAKLDELVVAAMGKSSQHTMLAKNPLKAASTEIAVNVNRKNLTVKLNAYVIPEGQVDSAQTVCLDEIVRVFTFDEETTTDEMLEAVNNSGMESAAFKTWNYGMSNANYDRADQVSEVSAYEFVYEVTYTPKMYELKTYYDLELDRQEMVPYGYNVTLKNHSNPELSYDYSVNAESYSQGQVYRVVGDTTIMGTEGKAREDFKFAALVAEDYKDKLTEKERAILSSKALISDTLSIRMVDNSEENRIVADGQSVIAESYHSGVDYLNWLPEKASLTRGTEVIESVEFEENTAHFESTNYEYIDVEYRLDIKVGDDVMVKEYLNLPKKLSDEAAKQKADMDELLNPNVYNNLGSLNKTMLNAMAGNLGEDSKAAIEFIKEKSFNGETGKFYLYEYLTEYKKSGLTYYYQDNNYARIKEQVVLLADQLAVVAADEQLPSLLEDLGYGAYKNKIDSVVNKLQSMKDSFNAPNVAIDTESEYLAELVNALVMDGEVSTYDKADGLKMTEVLKEAAANIVFVNISVSVYDGKNQLSKQETASFPLVKGSVIEDVSVFTDAIVAMEESLGIDKSNYELTSGSEMMEPGTEVSSNINLTFNWSPNKYQVSIDGTDIVLGFTYDDARITLPLCEEPKRAYVYTIAGKEFEATVSNSVFDFLSEFTFEEFNEIFKESKELVITRRIEDVGRRNVLQLVEKLNEAIAQSGYVDAENNLKLAFIPVEKDGELSVVLRLPMADIGQNLMGAMPALAKELITSKYSYVAFDGSAFINEGTVSLQSFINMILANNGFGSGTFLNAIDENGDIVELQLDGATVIGAKENAISVSKSQINEASTLGGELFNVSLALGAGEDTIDYEVPLYITIEDFDKQTEELKSLRAAIALSAEYMTLESKDNCLTVTRSLSDHEYGAVLVRMAMEGKVDLSDLSDLKIKDMFDNERETIQDALNSDEFNAQSLKATGEVLGLSMINYFDDKTIDSAVSMLKHLADALSFEEISSTKDNYTYNAVYSLDSLFSRYNIPSGFKNLIAESDGQIIIPSSITLTNLNEEYEALIVKASSSEAYKYMVTKDVDSAVSGADYEAFVSLLSDVDSSIHFRKASVLNLNGKTVNGGLSAAENVRVMDNSGKTSTVTGNVSGNLSITSGSYADDVSAVLADGYIVEYGKVKNRYFDITKDINGNYIIELDPDYLAALEKAEQEYIAVEMATAFALNAYSFANLKVAGTDIYNAENILWTESVDAAASQAVVSLKLSGIKSLANKLFADLTSFGKIDSSASSGSDISSYVVTETPWEFKAVFKNYDKYTYVGTDAVEGNSSSRKMLTLRVGGTEEEKEALGKLCDYLKNAISFNKASLDITDISYVDSKLNVASYGSFDVAIDYSNDDNYAISLGILAAYGNQDNEAIVEAVSDADSSSRNIAPLLSQLESYTLEELVRCINEYSDLSLSDMATSLGLESISFADYEKDYRDVMKVTLAFLSRAGLTAEGKALSEFKQKDTFAEFKFSNIETDAMKLNLTVNLAEEREVITPSPAPTESISPTQKPIYTAPPVSTATPAPIITPAPTGSGNVKAVLEIENSESLYGGETEGTVIVLDAVGEGITPEELLGDIVSFEATNGRVLEDETKFAYGVKNGIVTNGATVDVVVYTEEGLLKYELFTVIIKGDVNCDGKVNNTDVILFTDYWLGYNDTQLSDIQKSAADMDDKGTWNNTDAVLMLDKIFEYPYESSLTNH